MTEDNGKLSRREALKTTAKVAGAAAFATPVVMSTFSNSALAFTGNWSACDGSQAAALGKCISSDSDAIALDLTTGNRDWNLNCGGPNDGQFGRYNANRTDFTYTQTLVNNVVVTATLKFGANGTDNFPVDSGFYTITASDSTNVKYQCTAYWSLKLSSGQTTNQGCTGTNDVRACSIAPAGTNSVPYCQEYNANKNTFGCLSNGFLYLEKLVCCPQ